MQAVCFIAWVVEDVAHQLVKLPGGQGAAHHRNPLCPLSVQVNVHVRGLLYKVLLILVSSGTGHLYFQPSVLQSVIPCKALDSVIVAQALSHKTFWILGHCVRQYPGTNLHAPLYPQLAFVARVPPGKTLVCQPAYGGMQVGRKRWPYSKCQLHGLRKHVKVGIVMPHLSLRCIRLGAQEVCARRVHPMDNVCKVSGPPITVW
jgi:hypothetical protein